MKILAKANITPSTRRGKGWYALAVTTRPVGVDRPALAWRVRVEVKVGSTGRISEIHVEPVDREVPSSAMEAAVSEALVTLYRALVVA